MTYEDMEPGLHAALASYVSAWEAYVEGMCIEILDVIGKTAIPHTAALLTVLRLEASANVKSFNTPNFENSRNLILRFTGFDPYNHIIAVGLGLTAQQTQTRLNEILKVRHAFAHGLPIPSFPWLTRYGITSRLSKKNVGHAGQVISQLVESIDNGASEHLATVFGIHTGW